MSVWPQNFLISLTLLNEKILISHCYYTYSNSQVCQPSHNKNTDRVWEVCWRYATKICAKGKLHIVVVLTTGSKTTKQTFHCNVIFLTLRNQDLQWVFQSKKKASLTLMITFMCYHLKRNIKFIFYIKMTIPLTSVKESVTLICKICQLL